MVEIQIMKIPIAVWHWPNRKVFCFVGAGVSGGEEGALNGASIMPGGSVTAWDEVKPILQSIAARAADGTPCCDWIGPAGSGHFVQDDS